LTCLAWVAIPGSLGHISLPPSLQEYFMNIQREEGPMTTIDMMKVSVSFTFVIIF